MFLYWCWKELPLSKDSFLFFSVYLWWDLDCVNPSLKSRKSRVPARLVLNWFKRTKSEFVVLLKTTLGWLYIEPYTTGAFLMKYSLNSSSSESASLSFYSSSIISSSTSKSYKLNWSEKAPCYSLIYFIDHLRCL